MRKQSWFNDNVKTINSYLSTRKSLSGHGHYVGDIVGNHLAPENKRDVDKKITSPENQESQNA